MNLGYIFKCQTLLFIQQLHRYQEAVNIYNIMFESKDELKKHM